MTEVMIKKAQENRRRLGYTNVEFRLANNEADVVVSKYVMNLVPDKQRTFL